MQQAFLFTRESRNAKTGNIPVTTSPQQTCAESCALKSVCYAKNHNLGYIWNREQIRSANENGFTINLSGNTLEHADKLAALNIGPVVCLLPQDISGNQTVTTPRGRKVVVCPATYRDDTTCKSCGLCQIRDRKVIVGFPAHGASKKAASQIARQ